ncbi:MAG: hypothetical protein N2578_08190, partial [Bdellovibrionaceae bacterium]|nr:hypothetical protein [Pseudobdellovibrionaceae bacterium]
MKNKATRFLIFVISIAALNACSGGGFETIAASKAEPNPGRQDGQGSVPEELAKIDMKGYVSQGTYEGIQTIDLDKERGELVVSLPLG